MTLRGGLALLNHVSKVLTYISSHNLDSVMERLSLFSDEWPVTEEEVMSGRTSSVLAEMRHVGKHMWGQLEKGLKRQGIMGLGAIYIISFHYNERAVFK